ncbi:hypothetical protein HDU96_010975 [Phlyctochytrium bullatum]|nr:hypothetical protein HDU96_010975 [Phlyctochytrium bullatum]
MIATATATATGAMDRRIGCSDDDGTHRRRSHPSVIGHRCKQCCGNRKRQSRRWVGVMAVAVGLALVATGVEASEGAVKHRKSAVATATPWRNASVAPPPMSILDDDDKDKDKDKKKDGHESHPNERNHCLDRLWKEKDPCAFIRSDACRGVGEGALFSYTEVVACRVGRSWIAVPPMLMMLGLYLLNLFSVAGIVAADFFGSGLRTVLGRFGVPATVITAILLAFGNGSIEVFAAISATRSGQTNLAYGELVSSAFVVTTFMVGVVAMFHPFKFVRRAFLRDTVFFLGVVIVSIIILSDDDIKLFEGAGFLIMYGVYMILVTFGANWFGRDHVPLNSVPEEDEDAPPFLDDDVNDNPSFRVWEPRPASERNRPLIFSYFDRFLPPKETARDGEVQEGLLAGSSSRLGSLESGLDAGENGMSRIRSYGTLTPSAGEISGQISRGQSKSLWSAYAVAEAGNRSVHNQLTGTTSSAGGFVSARRGSLQGTSLVAQATTLEWLFPTLPIGYGVQQTAWERRTLFERVLSVVIAPSIFVVRLMIPTVYDPENESARLANVPEGVVPVRASRAASKEVLFEGEDVFEPRLSMPALDADGRPSLVGGASAAAAGPSSTSPSASLQHLPLPTPTPRKHIILPPTTLVLAQTFFAGFLITQCVFDIVGMTAYNVYASVVMSVFAGMLTANAAKAAPSVDAGMTWYVHVLAVLGSLAVLHFVAKEVVAVVLAVGAVLGIGTVLVAITLYAIGSNLGDLVTNISLAHLGYTSMGVRTSFVAPMLNLLFGIGLSTIWVITLYGGKPSKYLGFSLLKKDDDDDDDDDDEIAIFTSTSVLVILYGLLASIAFSAVWVPLKGFRAERTYGFALVALWTVVMTAAVVLEFGFGAGAKEVEGMMF